MLHSSLAKAIFIAITVMLIAVLAAYEIMSARTKKRFRKVFIISVAILSVITIVGMIYK
jgi:cytochrome bd-type quinol oxidase subunit 1